MQKTAVFFLVMFFLGGIVFNGYFYESEAMGVVSIAFLGLGGMLLFHHRRRKLTGFQLIMILYALSYSAVLPWAADPEKAIVLALQMLVIVPILFLGNHVSTDSNALIMKTIAWSGALITVLGVLLELYRNQRLESTLQYANALAIFLLAAGLCSILITLHEKRVVYGLVLVVCIAGLCLTLSRSVWVLWGMSMAMLVLGKMVRGRALYALIAANIGGLAAAMAISRNVLFFIPRVKSISPDASELQARLMYWHDGFRMWLQHPWGVGGGGWAALLPEYGSKSYFVAYVHNYYLQTALDAGVIGIVLLVLAICVFYRTVWTERTAGGPQSPIRQGIPIIVTALLLHAGFDFDASFPLLLCMLVYFMNVYITVETKPSRPIWEREQMSRQTAAAIPLMAIAVFAGYMAIAYGHKEAGQTLLRSSPNRAAEKLLLAERMIPWSSSIPYETAKAYVAEGNQTGSAVYYHNAEKHIITAMQKAPRQQLYIELFEQLQEVKK